MHSYSSAFARMVLALRACLHAGRFNLRPLIRSKIPLPLALLIFALSSLPTFSASGYALYEANGMHSSLAQAKASFDATYRRYNGAPQYYCDGSMWRWDFDGTATSPSWRGTPTGTCIHAFNLNIRAVCAYGYTPRMEGQSVMCCEGNSASCDAPPPLPKHTQDKAVPDKASCNDACGIPMAVGDPVGLDRGRTLVDEVDYPGVAPSPLRFERHYDNLRVSLGASPAGGNWESTGWTHTYDIRLVPQRDEQGVPRMAVKIGAKVITFALVDGTPKDDAVNPLVHVPPVVEPGDRGYWRDAWGRIINDFEVCQSHGTPGLYHHLWYQSSPPDWTPASLIGQFASCTAGDMEHHVRYARCPGGSLQVDRLGCVIPAPSGFYANRLWRGDDDSAPRLTQSSDGWLFTSWDESVIRFNLQLAPVSQTFRNGTTLTFATDAQNRITQVTDSFQRSLTIQYDGDWIQQLVTPGGQTIRFGYAAGVSGAYNLASVTYADGSQRQYRYEFQTETPIMGRPAYLTDLIDERNVVFASWRYDPQTGRTIAMWNAGEVDRHDLSYAVDGQGEVSTVTVTDPYRVQRSYAMSTALGTTQAVGEVLPATATTPASQRTQSYDAKNKRVRYTDFNGMVTSYRYDPVRNLEISRTVAEGTPDAQTISTRWSPAFRLPVAQASPFQLETYELDPLGRTVKYTVQPTADASGSQGFDAAPVGAASTWTYAYNALGQLVEETAPTNRTTRYAYDTQGKLTTVTDPAGLVTQYTAYDAEGRPLSITQPDGTIIALAYDLRGRLTSRSVGALQTRYVYAATGLLTSVVTPDRTVNYDYDDAHRLIAIRDTLGNRIAYTLDATGKRTREDVVDSSGSLATLMRTIESDLQPLAQPQAPKAS